MSEGHGHENHWEGFLAGRAVAVCVNVMLEGWSPGTWPKIGPMGNPIGESVIDHQALSWAAYGIETGIDGIRRELSRAGVPATVFASGMFTETAPGVLRSLAAEGYEIAAHAWSQDQSMPLLSWEAEQQLVVKCFDSLARLLGEGPRGWLSPRCTPGYRTHRTLTQAGFDWWADVFDADVPYLLDSPEGSIVAFPFQMELNDLPHRIRFGLPYYDFLLRWREELQAARDAVTPRWIDLTLHAHISGRPSGLSMLRSILDEAVSSPDLWITTRSELLAAYVSSGTVSRRNKSLES